MVVLTSERDTSAPLKLFVLSRSATALVCRYLGESRGGARAGARLGARLLRAVFRAMWAVSRLGFRGGVMSKIVRKDKLCELAMTEM